MDRPHLFLEPHLSVQLSGIRITDRDIFQHEKITDTFHINTSNPLDE
jgi:hypothetical protein